MNRNYIVFGSDDKVNWELLNTVEAGGSQSAVSQARAQEQHRYYAAVPERNWFSAEPDVVERPPVVKWNSLSPGQPTVDEVLEEEKQEQIEEARHALEEDPPAPPASPSEAAQRA